MKSLAYSTEYLDGLDALKEGVISVSGLAERSVGLSGDLDSSIMISTLLIVDSSLSSFSTLY